MNNRNVDENSKFQTVNKKQRYLLCQQLPHKTLRRSHETFLVTWECKTICCKYRMNTKAKPNAGCQCVWGQICHMFAYNYLWKS